ncbi:UDP-N-acetylmuramoyl-L-alanyl-D-glutamate--2,6-diaminopimelate ligase [Methylovorus sp. MP688]|uniref:UDP-N-acetylmuramoyl-L-alanyl-D-glutamate--2, 6-diaminopimelate ligase n=1 Tax=Methylovorus sp. (strain MP688) TaxID=887061 RepID=UPI0001EC440A|nr:UDP-N-acetylmuramoyl-L-alanyl-D-glutamate--2,6-diaminopimelate ligase [Methylovorus sp. MP688]ADQ83659.1 UDP-N-acetylmuramyl-tripeptide synthetase [Methylovorus sp. MP688]
MTILASLHDLGIRPSSLTSDSRKVTAGSLFVAYPGDAADGRAYIPQAIANGAGAVLWEAEGFSWPTDLQAVNLPVKDLRKQAGEIADEFYGHPSRALWMVGVTGTNGKTSCTQWLTHCLNSLQRKTAVIGTLGNGFPGELATAINTTPDPIVLHGLLAEYLKQGAVATAMEVSSHGLDQGRVNGVHFDVAVFTNLTRDHLDYHGDMDSYAAAKRRLMEWPGLKLAVLNAEDAYGLTFLQALRSEGRPVLSYGMQSGDVHSTSLHLHETGMQMSVTTPWGDVTLQASVMGRFNAYNLLAVLATLLAMDVPLEAAAQAIATLKPVPGRMEQYGGNAMPVVVIDYAHTPDALENALQALREQTRGKLWCVFGCGGDRDAGKRPMMGAIASRLADHVVVTSDNPRSENPDTIIADITASMGRNHQIMVDRRAAIAHAIEQAAPGDIVLVAGKGHETYQEIKGVRHPYSDVDVVTTLLGAVA